MMEMLAMFGVTLFMMFWIAFIFGILIKAGFAFSLKASSKVALLSGAMMFPLFMLSVFFE